MNETREEIKALMDLNKEELKEVEELKKEIEWLKKLVDWLKDNMNYRNPYPWYPYDPIHPNYSNPPITWKLVESDGTIPIERLEGY